jgi:hypothetical protein
LPTLPSSAICHAVLLLLVCGPPHLVAAQAPARPAIPPSTELPRFTLRQLILGPNRSEPHIPEVWLRAAVTTPPESLASRAYRQAASRMGIEPLGGNVLVAQRSQQVMGLYRRAELVAVSQRTLEAIRSAIPSDTVRALFDRIFQPNGQWIVDLHDAALAWARIRVPGIGWNAARAALTGAHWLTPKTREPEAESLPRALYALAVLAATDSVAFAQARASLWRADSASAEAAMLLLKGYSEGRRWYADALDFFLRQPWVPDGSGRSVRDYVHGEWLSVPIEVDTALPRIETRWFGYPQAVPQYGIPPALFARLIHSDNPAGTEWLQQRGQRGLLGVLRLLPRGDTTLTLLRTPTSTLRLSTVSTQARESLNGFLEPEDAIVIDPGYSPLMALGAVVHEWQHLLFRRQQLEQFARSRSDTGDFVRLPGVQPYLAEGFAEWSSERILRPLTDRWPLLALGELEKRADLNQREQQDQHALGYALVSTLFSALGDPGKTTRLLLRHAEDPGGIIKEPVLRKAWRSYHGGPRQVPRTPALQVLIPEVTFTVDENFPDVVATRILVPAANAATR